MRKVAYCILMIFLAGKALCQLPESEMAYLEKIKSVCGLTAEQGVFADSIFIKSQRLMNDYDDQVKAWQSSDSSEVAISQHVNELFLKKKDCRDMRDMTVRLMMTPEQQQIFDRDIRPAKPSVLHFGVKHERATCPVCK